MEGPDKASVRSGNQMTPRASTAQRGVGAGMHSAEVSGVSFTSGSSQAERNPPDAP